jgi:two-component system capsular synthesis response regulator RcsB
MTNKVLVADGFDGIGLCIGQILKQHSVSETDYTKYHDDTYLRIKRAVYDKTPYNLLISDLNFKVDYRDTKLNSAEELIVAIKKIQPNIKIIIFSEEVKSFRIKSLFKDHNINAFVYKGRNSILELHKAIETIFVEDTKHTSLELEALQHRSLVDVREYDISLLKLISYGYTLDEISKSFKNTGLTPSSESSIEKSTNKLRTYFNAKNKVHLIAITKDLGLI